MAEKRKTLPKDFDELIRAGDMDALKAVFDKCDINAYSGSNKEPALGTSRIPVELVRWLVSQGADINLADITYLRTPLHRQAMFNGELKVFLELGAAVNAADTYGNTPLHFAACSYKVQNVIDLLEHGANPLAKNNSGQIPLEKALAGASNLNIPTLAKITPVMLKAGVQITPFMRERVTKLGENFEFHREDFNKDRVAEVSDALDSLYVIFDVPPVKKRIMHDGVSPIMVGSGTPIEQHNELWEMLVPGSGSAKTVQGEVIRITGRVHDEIYRNGGANWDANYKKMLDSLMIHLSSGTPLGPEMLKEAETIVKSVRSTGDGDEELIRLCELSVKWVQQNPNPVPLGKPTYNR